MAKYWKQRSIDTEKLIQDKTDATIVKVNKMFEKTLRDIEREIKKIFSTYATNGNMDFDEARTLLNSKQTREAYNELKRIYDRITDPDIKLEVLNRLNAPSYASRIEKLEALRDLIYSECQLVGCTLEYALQSRLIDAYTTSYYHTHYTIQKGTGLGYDFRKLTNPLVKSAIATDWKGSNYSKRIWANTDTLATELEEIITSGLLGGVSGQKMATELVKRVNTERYKANRLIRTEVNYVAGQSRLATYKEIGTEKYIFIATLDLRTSSLCRELDKTIHLVSDAQVGVNFPPMHPNCRSVDSAYIEGKDYSKLKRRARNPVTGETYLVPSNMTYTEWYNKYVKGNPQAEANERAIKNGNKKPYKKR